MGKHTRRGATRRRATRRRAVRRTKKGGEITTNDMEKRLQEHKQAIAGLSAAIPNARDGNDSRALQELQTAHSDAYGHLVTGDIAGYNKAAEAAKAAAPAASAILQKMSGGKKARKSKRNGRKSKKHARKHHKKAQKSRKQRGGCPYVKSLEWRC